GEVDLSVPQAAMIGASLVVSLLDSNGQILGKSEDIGKTVVDGWNHYTLDTAALPEGEYKLSAELKSSAGEPIVASSGWKVISRRLARVTINSHGYCVYDVTAILPIGIFNACAHLTFMVQAV